MPPDHHPALTAEEQNMFNATSATGPLLILIGKEAEAALLCIQSASALQTVPDTARATDASREATLRAYIKTAKVAAKRAARTFKTCKKAADSIPSRDSHVWQGILSPNQMSRRDEIIALSTKHVAEAARMLDHLARTVENAAADLAAGRTITPPYPQQDDMHARVRERLAALGLEPKPDTEATRPT